MRLLHKVAGRQTTTGSLLIRSQAECVNVLEVNGLLIKLAGHDRMSGSMVPGLNGVRDAKNSK